MQDNSTIELLIRYMDGELGEDERKATEKLLQEDASLQEYYQHLIAAKEGIKSQGIKERVQAVHNEYIRKENDSESGTVKFVKPKFFSEVYMDVAVKLL